MPRSPSRDLSDRFEGNRRYFHRPTRLGRAKAILLAVALVATAVWSLADVLFPTQAVLAHTHGPISNPHVHWEDDCTACHREQSPRDLGLGSIFRARDRWHDLTCEKCHAGPPHVSTLPDVDRDTEARCSTCHHEHGGRLNSLVRISDDHCTRCHADLPAHHIAGNSTCASPITTFTQNHPEFG
ncbi:MAG TPA: hypothetical protein VLM40_00250, partial [Gemmata sp.]|nr:hypothetical protein [Gemmata sp.]